jgi:hypothetical protein
MFFLSHATQVSEFRKAGAKDKKKRKKNVINTTTTKVTKTLEPVKVGQKIWSTGNNTSREVRSWLRTIKQLTGK